MKSSNPPRLNLKAGTKVQRFLTVDRAMVDVASRTVSVSFASETPYSRWWGVEVLNCSADAVRTGRLLNGAPLLWNHESDDQIGVVESVSIGPDRICRAVVRFSKNPDADEVFTDVQDGICRNISVGYIIHAAELQAPDPADPEADDVYLVSDWEPYEISVVPVPADPSVGVGRNAENDPRQAAPEAIADAPQPRITTITPSLPSETRTMTASPALNLSEEAAAARAIETTRIREISAIGDQFETFGGRKIASEAINSGATVDAVRSLVMNAMAATQTAPVTHLDLSKADTKRYSVLRAIRSMVDRDWRGAGFEKEASEAICQRAGLQSTPNGGIFLPTDIQQRDLTVATASAGGNLVATNLVASSFYDILRARSLLASLGATTLSGLVGAVAIPKITGSGTAYWLTNEATAVTESNATFGQLTLAPKNVGAYMELSRQLLMQSTPSADGLVMNDLAKVLALAIDLAGFEGSGSSGQPTGISATSSIGGVTGTSIALAGITEFQTDLASANALTPNCAYVTTPAVAGLLKQRARFSNTDTPLWVGNVLDGTVDGYRGATTTQVTAASMVFGDFSQVVIAEWGFLELALNPYASFTAAISGIRAIQTVDVGVRHAAAFSRATSIT